MNGLSMEHAIFRLDYIRIISLLENQKGYAKGKTYRVYPTTCNYKTKQETQIQTTKQNIQ